MSHQQQGDFEDLVSRAIDQVPSPFAEQLDSVAIVVEDAPAPALLEELGVTGLFGLYQGVPRTAWGADGAALPSKITIYSLPHEQQYGSPEVLAAAVEETLFHEVAHHFGISDERLRELQAEG